MTAASRERITSTEWGVWGQVPTAAAAEFDWSAIPPSEEGGYNVGGDREAGDQEDLRISMLPLESVSWSWQPPEPIVPVSDSPPTVPVAVMGSSVETWPKEVREIGRASCRERV